GNDLRLSEQRVEHGRNVANKIWQAARFVLAYGDNENSEFRIQNSESLELPERWIRSQTLAACRDVSRQLTNFQLGEAARTVEDFFWGDFCDWYLESVKPRVLGAEHAARGPAAQETLRQVLALSVRLLHPFMPYVTEEIWQHLRAVQPHLPATIAIASWPGAEAGLAGAETVLEAWDDPEADAQMGLVIEAITAIRNLRSERGIEPSRTLQVFVTAEELRQQAYLMDGLANASVQPAGTDAPKDAVRLFVGANIELLVGAVFDREAEQSRLNEELSAAQQELERAGKQLDQPGFRDRAPEHVVQKAEERLAAARERVGKLEQQLRDLG
ncbi:MAG TPA: class I tRNA ligase family protein, partial [Chloroflexota bacterium]|nr:class I tRNA ligase family protein [Chloroflexota bacterium]